MRKLHAAAGTFALAAGLIALGAQGAQAQEPALVRHIAVCENRLCLVLLAESADSDGDGVADADEAMLGTAAADALSRPEVKIVLDAAIAGELPSFAEHLTELVALPRMTPDGRSLATGLGAIELRRDRELVASIDELLRDLIGNGFDRRTNVAALLDRPPLAGELERFSFGARGNRALYSSELNRTDGIVGPSQFGANGDKRPTGTSNERFTWGSGGSSYGHRYSVTYEDGSRDDVVTSVVRSSDTYTDGAINVTSYDADGTKVGFTSISGNVRTDSDGSHTTSTTVETTTYDSDGSRSGSTKYTQLHTENIQNEDGSVTEVYHTTETTYDENGNQVSKTETQEKNTYHPDGTVWTYVATWTYDAEGNVVSHDEDAYVQEADDEDFENPEHVGFGPITGADLDRVAARLNSTRNPGPDTGDIDLNEVEPHRLGAYNPLVAMVNPDGVVAFAIGTNPTFNRARPEYDPQVAELAGYAGVSPPQDDGTGPVSWP